MTFKIQGEVNKPGLKETLHKWEKGNGSKSIDLGRFELQYRPTGRKGPRRWGGS